MNPSNVEQISQSRSDVDDETVDDPIGKDERPRSSLATRPRRQVPVKSKGQTLVQSEKKDKNKFYKCECCDDKLRHTSGAWFLHMLKKHKKWVENQRNFPVKGLLKPSNSSKGKSHEDQQKAQFNEKSSSDTNRKRGQDSLSESTKDSTVLKDNISTATVAKKLCDKENERQQCIPSTSQVKEKSTAQSSVGNNEEALRTVSMAEPPAQINAADVVKEEEALATFPKVDPPAQIIVADVVKEEDDNEPIKISLNSKEIVEKNPLPLSVGIFLRAQQHPSELMVTWTDSLELDLITATNRNSANSVLCIKEVEMFKVTDEQREKLENSQAITFTMLDSDDTTSQWTVITFGEQKAPVQLKNKLFRRFYDVEKLFSNHAGDQGKTVTNMLRYSKYGLFPLLSQKLAKKTIGFNFME